MATYTARLSTRPLCRIFTISASRNTRLTDRLQPPVPPRRDLLQYRVGDLGNQRRTHLHAVDLLQMALNLARLRPASLRERDVLVETGKARQVSGQTMGHKSAVVILGASGFRCLRTRLASLLCLAPL